VPERQPRNRFAVLCSVTFFHFLSMGVFLSALPLYVTRELNGSRAAVGLAVGAFSITAVLTRPFVGRQVDLIGRAWFVRGAPMLVAATSLALFGAKALVAVVGLRLLQGLAGSAFYTSAATVATDLGPKERRAEYISRFSLFLYGGFAAGPALGEWLIEQRGFGWAWGAAGCSALVAASLSFLLPETRPARIDPDAVRVRRMVHPAALGPGLVLMTFAVGYTSISAFTPLYARSIGMGSSGTLYVTFAMTILIVRLVSGRMADRYGRVAVALPGLAAGAGGMFLLAGVAEPAAAYVGVAAFAAGHALIFPALMALTVDRVSEDERGEALGSFTACFDVGAAAGGYLVGFIADQAGFGAAWAAPGVLCVFGAIALLTMSRRLNAEAEAFQSPEVEPAGT
jgi:MFS family permease